MKSIKRGAVALRLALDNPFKILGYCLLFFVVTVSLNGTPLRLWALHRDLDYRQLEIQKNINDIKELELKIAQTSDLNYIEREARDRLDLAGPDDLIFVFPTQ